MAGSVILGLPDGQFPEFEREHTVEDWQRILRQVLTPKDLWQLNQQLGRIMRGRTYFFLQTTPDYKTTVETRPPHKTESGKQFWSRARLVDLPTPEHENHPLVSGSLARVGLIDDRRK
jgi:hypothetical protein